MSDVRGSCGCARVPSSTHSCAATVTQLLRVVDDDVTSGGRKQRRLHGTGGGRGSHQRLRVEGVRRGSAATRLSEVLHADDEGLHAGEGLAAPLDQPGGCGQIPDDIEAAHLSTKLDVL